VDRASEARVRLEMRLRKGRRDEAGLPERFAVLDQLGVLPKPPR
jgi:hypothetical protein